MEIVARAVRDDAAALAAARPDWHRGVRRYPVPVQLALGALEDVRASIAAPNEIVIVSCAPRRAGSPEVHAWVRQIFERERAGQPAPRMNPTHTLHVVDNLALSVAAISLATHAEGFGVGGAPAQAAMAIEYAAEALARGAREVLILAGDQEDATKASRAVGAAIVVRAGEGEDLAAWLEGVMP